MTHAKLEDIFRTVARHIPNSGSVGDLHRLAEWIRYYPADFHKAIVALNERGNR